MSDGSSDEAEAPLLPHRANRNPVAEDGKGLLIAFSRKQSVKYTDFKQSWQDLQFSFVYCAGGDLPRRKEIVLCLYVEGLHYLTNRKRPDHERLAGLYLIYTVYCTQPVDPKVLVKVTPDDWTILMQLQEAIREKYAEAAYILKHMRSQRAFDITYTVHQKCLCVSSGDHTSGQLYQTFLTCPYSLSPHFFSSLTQDIQQSVDDYCSAKEERKVLFPQHLLNPNQLPQDMKKILEEYETSVTVKLKRFRY